MQVTLRKADTFQNELAKKARELGPINVFDTTPKGPETSETSLDTVTRISIYERKPEKVVEEKKKQFDNALDTKNRIYDVIYELRDKINEKNKEVGIDKLLNNLARVQKEIELYGDIAMSPARKSDNELKKLMEKEQNKRDLVSLDTVETGLFNQDEIEKFKKHLDELKREKINVKDKLLEKNVENKIDLSDFAEVVLRDNRLID